MLLRDTELIGKKLVKYGCYRSSTNHQHYRIHYIDSHTTVKFTGYEAVFTPEWLREEHDKLQAMFKFARG